MWVRHSGGSLLNLDQCRTIEIVPNRLGTRWMIIAKSQDGMWQLSEYDSQQKAIDAFEDLHRRLSRKAKKG